MNEKGEFTYNGRPCGIVYKDKKFHIAVYKDSERSYIDDFLLLFPVTRYSESQRNIALYVAINHALPYIIR